MFRYTAQLMIASAIFAMSGTASAMMKDSNSDDVRYSYCWQRADGKAIVTSIFPLQEKNAEKLDSTFIDFTFRARAMREIGSGSERFYLCTISDDFGFIDRHRAQYRRDYSKSLDIVDAPYAPFGALSETAHARLQAEAQAEYARTERQNRVDAMKAALSHLEREQAKIDERKAVLNYDFGSGRISKSSYEGSMAAIAHATEVRRSMIAGYRRSIQELEADLSAD